MFQRILLAWDGSELAVRAFDVAIDVARRYEAELVAVSIAYSPGHAETAADRTESSQAAHHYLTQTFAEIVDRARRAGLEVTHTVIEGETASTAVADFAQEHGFDLIVCGHHPTRRAGRLLLHGVAEPLIEGPTPVLVVSDRT